jgi:glutamate-1-semialdehyde 2,1-aminomutase
MGLVTPTDDFRKELRRLTHHHGSMLVYDEVMTGFRLAPGGAQQILNEKPDITVLGKIVGGGYPVGAYGGRADIMKKIMPAGPVFQAGTLSGNPVAMAAGIATLRELRENPPYERLEKASAKIEAGLRKAATDAGIPHSLNRVGSMWTLFFTPTKVVDLETAKTSDTKKFGRFFWAMMDRGVYLPCSQFEAAFTCAAHSDTDIEATIAAARDSLKEIR